VEKLMDGLSSALAAFLAFAITGLSGIWLVPFLRRLKFGQSIRKVGPTWHKAKEGTPVMGGLMFAAGIVLSMFILYYVCPGLLNIKLAVISDSQRATLAGGIFMALVYGFIGFMDDYIKVVKKRNLGLTVMQKLFLQVAAAFVFLFVRYLSDAHTAMNVPFTAIQLHMPIYVYFPLAIFIIVGFVNAVNLTDGVDGLCSSVTFVAAVAFMMAAKMLSQSGYTALAAALAGGCLGFLVWNFHPAKIFMGDTGSHFLGGLLCALAFGINEPLLLVPIGIIYVVETLSVIIQVISFKTTGKRVFKMSPIHHHFELSGWSENKIVVVFSFVTVACSICALLWLWSNGPY